MNDSSAFLSMLVDDARTGPTAVVDPTTFGELDRLRCLVGDMAEELQRRMGGESCTCHTGRPPCSFCIDHGHADELVRQFHEPSPQTLEEKAISICEALFWKEFADALKQAGLSGGDSRTWSNQTLGSVVKTLARNGLRMAYAKADHMDTVKRLLE